MKLHHVLLVSLALIAGAPVAVQAQQPVKDRVHTITGKGETFLQPDGWFVGKATFVVNGQALPVSSRTLQIGEETLSDGKTQIVTTHIFDFGNGNTIQTLDNGLMTPTETPGKFRLQGTLTIARGTGIYKNAIGKFGGPGGFIYFNETQPRAQWECTATVTLVVAAQSAP